MNITKDFTKILKLKFKNEGVSFSTQEVKKIEQLFVDTLFEEVSSGVSAKISGFGTISSHLRKLKLNSKNLEGGFRYFNRFVISLKSSKALKDKINEEIKIQEELEDSNG